MTPERVDVAVVGAGPAGSSAAALLGRAGVSVALLDRAAFPRPKPCGEGLMPAARPRLASLGVLEAVERAARPFDGLAFTSPSGGRAVARFREGRVGLSLPRVAFDSILLDRARSERTVRVFERRAVESVSFEGGARLRLAGGASLEASFVLGADGAHSVVARSLGVRRVAPARRRFGLRTHLDGVAGLGDEVEVFFADGFEAFLAPQPGGRALASILSGEARLARLRGPQAFLAALRGVPSLRDRLSGAAIATPLGGAGPLGGAAERWEGDRWLLAGDAAASVDPITGEGMTLALEAGRLAADELLSRLGGGNRGAYSGRYRAELSRWRRLACGLLAVSARPGLCDALVAFLGPRPAFFDRAFDWLTT